MFGNFLGVLQCVKLGKIKKKFYKFIWFIGRKLFSKVLQFVKLKKIE